MSYRAAGEEVSKTLEAIVGRIVLLAASELVKGGIAPARGEGDFLEIPLPLEECCAHLLFQGGRGRGIRWHVAFSILVFAILALRDRRHKTPK